MTKYRDWFIALAAIAGIILLLTDRYTIRKERDLYKTQVQNDFKSKYLPLERQLRESEQLRMGLVLRIDSIDNTNTNLVRVNKSLDSTLRKIRGSYSRKTPSELETEMINRYNKIK